MTLRCPMCVLALVSGALLAGCGGETNPGANVETDRTEVRSIDGYVSFLQEVPNAAFVVESLDGRSVKRFPMKGISAFEPVTSPSGNAIAFVGRPFPAQDIFKEDIFVADVPGAAPRPLHVPLERGEQIGAPAWSPDGNRIAFAGTVIAEGCAGKPSDVRIYVINRDGSGLRRMTGVIPKGAAPVGENPAWVQEILWSPDGQLLIFHLAQGSDCESRAGYVRDVRISVIPAEGGVPLSLATMEYPSTSVSPDGSEVAIGGVFSFVGQLLLVELSGRATRSHYVAVGHPIWTDKGIYGVEEDGTIVLVDPDTGAVQTVAEPGSPDQIAAPKDGEWVCVLRRGTLSIYDADGSVVLKRRLRAGDPSFPSVVCSGSRAP